MHGVRLIQISRMGHCFSKHYQINMVTYMFGLQTICTQLIRSQWKVYASFLIGLTDKRQNIIRIIQK